MKKAILRCAALVLSATVFVLTGEAALRVVYRDAGRRTLGGPGNRPFEHLTTGPEELRGRRDIGPKRAGVSRLMVIGDSITYGQGVYDWHDAWPERLAAALEARGRPQEMAVFALPGRDIPQHLAELERWGKAVEPDVLIYQWYVNDIEVMSHRPDRTHGWQRWASHGWLRRHSYLYYFLDNRIGELIPPPDRSYVDYILQDFAPGSAEWTEFERYFHTFATEARALAPRRLMLLYPQVPYRGRYPLQPVHDRMKAMATPHLLSIPPVAWMRAGGALTADPAAPWQQALQVPAGFAGPLVDTRDYYFPPGAVDVEIVLRRTDANAALEVATLQMVDAQSKQVVAAQAIVLPADASGLHPVSLPLTLPGADGRHVRLRVLSAGHGAWALASLGVRVDYGIEVLDLAAALNTFNTHASVFDAHPNAAAHQVIADMVYHALIPDP